MPGMQWAEAIMTPGTQTLLLLLMGPVFAACIALETWWLRRRGPGPACSSHEASANTMLALCHALAYGVAWALLAGVFQWVYQHRLMDIPVNGWTLLGLLVAQDFCHYWLHRASHRVRWMWASHVTHHSSQTLNLSTALRHNPTHPISGAWIFWLPLAWLGFEPRHVIACVAVSMAVQFFVHTESIGRLPRLIEAVFNTPSHHRVHHARNPQYIDRNYGGVFIIWDRLFGTFVPEMEPCDYGIVRQVYTRNPLVMVLHEWAALLHDLCRPGPVAARLKHLWAPPEWQRPITERAFKARALLPAPEPLCDEAEDWPVHAGW